MTSVIQPEVNTEGAKLKQLQGKLKEARQEIKKKIVGQNKLIEGLFIALLTDGHVLLEGLPGLAKTLAVTTLASVISCSFKRIQFTPDLLPADLLGTTLYNAHTGDFSVKKGPLFTNMVLADEINRAPAKVQSALLEVMAEKQITIGNETFKIEDPFLVLATQNPVEQEGTYTLPEAQLDRFMMKIKVPWPSKSDEKEILQRICEPSDSTEVRAVLNPKDLLKIRKLVDKVYVDEKVYDYIVNIVYATRKPSKYVPELASFIECGVSPRGSISLLKAAKGHAFLQGRSYVTPHDVQIMGRIVLRHRLKISYEAQAEELSADQVLDKIFDLLHLP